MLILPTIVRVRLPGRLQVSLDPVTAVLRICPSAPEAWVRALERDAILWLNGHPELVEHLRPRYRRSVTAGRRHLTVIEGGQCGVG